jgi:hypothetical protein
MLPADLMATNDQKAILMLRGVLKESVSGWIELGLNLLKELQLGLQEFECASVNDLQAIAEVRIAAEVFLERANKYLPLIVLTTACLQQGLRGNFKKRGILGALFRVGAKERLARADTARRASGTNECEAKTHE